MTNPTTEQEILNTVFNSSNPSLMVSTRSAPSGLDIQKYSYLNKTGLSSQEILNAVFDRTTGTLSITSQGGGDPTGDYYTTTQIDEKLSLYATRAWVTQQLGTSVGTVVSVNQVDPVEGNITLSLSDIVGTEASDLLLSISSAEGNISIDSISLTSKTYVDTQDEKLKTAVEKAVNFYETTATMTQSSSGTPATATVSGRIVIVYDSVGNIIYPNISYSNGNTIITADFGEVKAETWTVIVAKAITVS